MAEDKRPTGGLFDPYDSRDRSLYSAEEVSAIHSSSRAPAAASASTKRFVLPNLPPIYDQGSIGSCVANASCAALRYAHKKHSGKTYDDFQPSRLFAYYFGRTTANGLNMGLNKESFVKKNIKLDAGTWNRAVLHAFLVHGVCEEKLWPYGAPEKDEEDNFLNIDKAPNPTEPANWAAVEWQAKGSSHPNDGKALSGQPDMIPRAISYYRILDPSKPVNVDPNTKKPVSAWENETKPSIQLLEQTLQSGFPFIFCALTFKSASFTNTEVKNGMYLTPDQASPLTEDGGHSMMAVGYDSTKKAFLIQNSWGDYYKHDADQSGGRFWMPYAWFDLVHDGKVAVSDYWVIKFNPKN